jgi:cardiolipin synthase
VLIDGVGMRYSRPPIAEELARRGVRVAGFLPPRLPWRSAYMNLRNHRKILVVDGRVGFVGGLNIREGCMLEAAPEHPVQDLHFRVEGPAVEQVFSAVVQDWFFTTGERLAGPAWRIDAEVVGDVLVRGIPDGPDEDFEALRWTVLAALGAAQRSVRIATPYFLPEQPLITQLSLAAMRGVEVDILLPRVNNLRYVQWASTALLWQVLQPGCRVWLTPPPFDHSKVMVVDGSWSLVGSANWDARSLRLNFEFNLECYDRGLAEALLALTDEKLTRARRVSLAEVDGRPIPIRLRDGVARLFSPYL